jgi:hypothetical protein
MVEVKEKVDRILRAYRRWMYVAPLPMVAIIWSQFFVRLPERGLAVQAGLRVVFTLLAVFFFSRMARSVSRQREAEAARLGAAEFHRVEVERQLRFLRWQPWVFLGCAAGLVVCVSFAPDRETIATSAVLASLAFGFAAWLWLVKRPRLLRERRETSA